MTDKNIPTPEELRKLLRYEPETGKLFWLHRPTEMFSCCRLANMWNTRFANREAFTAEKKFGYRQGRINGALFSAHRVIWALQTGEWPKNGVDHINGKKMEMNG